MKRAWLIADWIGQVGLTTVVSKREKKKKKKREGRGKRRELSLCLKGVKTKIRFVHGNK